MSKAIVCADATTADYNPAVYAPAVAGMIEKLLQLSASSTLLQRPHAPSGCPIGNGHCLIAIIWVAGDLGLLKASTLGSAAQVDFGDSKIHDSYAANQLPVEATGSGDVDVQSFAALVASCLKR